MTQLFININRKITNKDIWILIFIILISYLRLIITWNYDLNVVFAPHDDLLYVQRALNLFNNGDWGQYNSKILLKYPGISYLLTATYSYGISYLKMLNCIYIIAGLYFYYAITKAGCNKLLSLIIFIIYIFNPITFDERWFRIIREPLATVIIILIISSYINILNAWHNEKIGVLHFFILSIVFGFGVIVREEDVLLYIFPSIATIILILELLKNKNLVTIKRKKILILLILVPFLSGSLVNYIARLHVQKMYGLPILHDLGEGEYPKLVAAMRSVYKKNKDNRYIQVSQESLREIAFVISRLAPVIDRLPKPSKNSSSCEWLGLCNELSSAWLLFWIKDSAYDAGLTPSLVQAQEYFRLAREDIEIACKDGRLTCIPQGQGYIPPLELKWLRAYTFEFFKIISMSIQPEQALYSKVNTDVKIDNNVINLFSKFAFNDELIIANQSEINVALLNLMKKFTELMLAFYSLFSISIIILAFICWILLVKIKLNNSNNIVLWLGALGYGYCFTRIVALSYLAVFMGRYESRMIFPIYTTLMLISPIFILNLYQFLFTNKEKS